MKNRTDRPALTPKEFRELTGWSVYKMERETGIPMSSLYGYLSDPTHPKHRQPKTYVKRLFGLLYQQVTTNSKEGAIA